MKTTGNTVFITGGSAGIGLEIAKAFSQRENKVIINGRDKGRLYEALSQLGNAVAIQGDLSIEYDRVRIAKVLKEEHPDLNVVVNNAGEAYAYSLADGGYDHARREINTNYVSVVHFTELVMPLLHSKESGAIVNVTSIVGLVPSAVTPTYSASKAALHFYTQSLRKSLAEAPVRVFELMPPLVNTAFSAAIGGAKGISPGEVAEALLSAMGEDRFDVPVGRTRCVHGAISEAMERLQAQSA